MRPQDLDQVGEIISHQLLKMHGPNSDTRWIQFKVPFVVLIKK